MGLPLLILRLVATPILGTVIFIGFLLLMLENNLSNKLLNAGFYTETMAGQDTYNRIYGEVLVDPAIENTLRGLLGDIQVVSHQDIVGLLREILPPEYLQSQSEGAIRRSVDYYSGEAETLDLHIDLGPALDRVGPTLFAYIDRRIDELPEEDPVPAECTPDQVTRLAERFRAAFGNLTAGAVPSAIPSIKGIAEPCRILIFGAAFEHLVNDDSLDPRVKQGLQSNRAEIREEFVAGDTHGVLKQAARPLAAPLMADALDRIRAKLDDQDRLDVIEQLAKWSQGPTEEQLRAEIEREEQLRAEIERTRQAFARYRLLGQTWAIVILVGGAVVMGILYLPNLSAALRYPGISLFMTGVVFFGVGKFAESRVLDWLTALVDRITRQVPDIPGSIVNLGSDLLISFGRQLTDGFATHALPLLIVGVVLIAGSFFMMVVRRLIPGLG